MEEEQITFSEWMSGVSLTDGINIILMIVFTIVITILVVRTFRGKSSA